MSNHNQHDYRNDTRNNDPEELERLTNPNNTSLIVGDIVPNEKDKMGETFNNGIVRKSGKDVNENEEKAMKDDIDRILRTMPLTEDTTCGFWILKGSFFQK